MKIEIRRKARWVFGWELWGFNGKLQFDIGFYRWHIYFILKKPRED